MPHASSPSTDTNAAASSSGQPSPIQTPVSPVSPPSPQKLKKKRSKKNSESDDKPTLTRAISLSTSSMVTPLLNASGAPTPQSKKKASSVPKPQTRATTTPRKAPATPAGAAQKPKETTPPIQEPPSPFDGQDQLAKPITQAQADAEPQAKPKSPTRQLSYAAVTAKPTPPPETLLPKPIGTTRGKVPRVEIQGPPPRQQPYARQPAQQPQQRITNRALTPEERQRWEALRRSIEHDKAHMSWLENDAGNTDTAKLAVLERIIAYRDQYGTMPMEVTFKTAANAKGGVEKVVCGPCQKEGKTPKEYPTVQKAAVHITSNHWEMHLWLCTVPGCTKVFRCRDGIQNPKRHMEKAHPKWPQPNNPEASVYVANPDEQPHLAIPGSSYYPESVSGTEYSSFAPSIVSQFPEASNGGYANQAAYYAPGHEQQPITQESEAVYVQYAKGKGRSAGVPPAPLKLHPPLMPVPPAPLPDQFSVAPSASPSRSQGPMDEFLGKLSNLFGIGTSPTHQVQPTVGQSVVTSGKRVAFGSISPSEMQNVVPAQVPRAPMRRMTADTRSLPPTGATMMMMGPASLNVMQGRARNVSNPTTMYTPTPFQIPAYTPIPMQPMQTYAPPTQSMYQQQQQQPYAPSSHAASLSPQQTSPQYAASTGYGQTPESYVSSPPQKMPSTSPHSQGHLHLAYPSPASTGAFSASPPYSGTGSHMPPLLNPNMANTAAYLALQASGQHSPDQSSRSSLSSSPYPPVDDPLGYDYSQKGNRTSIGSGSGTGQPLEYGSGAPSLEYVNASTQAPLSSSSEYTQYPSLSDPLQLGAVPLSDVNAYSHGPPPQKTLPASDGPLSDVEFRQLQAYLKTT